MVTQFRRSFRSRGMAIACLSAVRITALCSQTIAFFPQAPSANPLENVRGLAADSTGFYRAGEMRELSYNTRNARAFLRKYDLQGKELWSRQFEDPSIATAVAVSGSGVYVAGNTEFGEILTSSRDAFVRLYDSSGRELWRRQFGGANHDYVRGIAADDSGVYVSSWSEPDPNPVQLRVWTERKFDPAGVELWSRTVDYPESPVLDGAGFYYVIGSDRYRTRFSLTKYNAAGIEVWTRSLGADDGGSLAANTRGVYLSRLIYPKDAAGFLRHLQFYDADGNLRWTRQIPAVMDEHRGVSLFSADEDGFYLGTPVSGTLEGQCRAGYADLQVSRFDLDGNRLWQRQFGTQEDDAPLAMLVTAEHLYVAGGVGSRVVSIARLDKATARPTAAPRIHNECVVNAANYVGGAIARGEMVTILGNSLGPLQGIDAHLSRDSPLPVQLADTRVLFNGIPGALLYVSDRQTTAIVPYSLPSDRPVAIEVEYLGARSNPVTLPLVESRLAVFSRDGSGRGPAAAWNEDGTPNSPGNPARPGSLITFYATGAPLQGVTSEARMIESPPPLLKTPVRVVFSGPYPEHWWLWDDAPMIGYEAEYSAGVAGSASGLVQIKVRVPIPGWYFSPGEWIPQFTVGNDWLASSLATISVGQ